jgi:hypothetical protein
MTSLGDTAIVGTLYYNQLIQDGKPPAQTVVLAGQFENVFSAAGGTDYMEWVSNPTPSNIIPSLTMPFDCKLKTMTMIFKSTTAITIPSGAKWKVDIGTMSANLPATEVNWNTLTGGVGLQTWDETLTGTFPNTITENINLNISKGQTLGVIGFETGSMSPTNVEVQVALVFEIVE